MSNTEKAWHYAYTEEKKRGNGISKVEVWTKDFNKRLNELQTKMFPSR